jgi:hypothetical protein
MDMHIFTPGSNLPLGVNILMSGGLKLEYVAESADKGG